MKKRDVRLDVFEDAVLPMLEAKHPGDAKTIQKSIDDEYDIYREDDEGKRISVYYQVRLSKSVASDDDKDGEGVEVTPAARKDAKATLDSMTVTDVKRLVAETATEATKATLKLLGSQGRNANPLGDNGNGANGANGKFTIPAECKRYGTLKAFTASSAGADYDPEMRAYRFGTWARAALGDEAAKAWCDENGLGLREKSFRANLDQKLHSDSTNTAGGLAFTA